MKLCYRGVHYETNQAQVQIAGKENIVKFRGCSYQLGAAVMTVSPEHQEGMVYRGVALSEIKTKRFLGSSYEHKTIVFVPVTAFS